MIGENARLLVIKHGALGDIIQGLDAFASLRNSFPSATITVLTSQPFAGFMQMMPYFDEVIIDHRAGFWRLDKMRQIRALFRRPFDAIIDLQCSKRTGYYFRLLANKNTKWIGNAAGCSHPNPDFSGVNNHQRMLTATRMLGAIDHSADLSFLAQTDDQLADVPCAYAVLMPGCSPAKPSKKWPAASYAALADKFHETGITPVVIGTKDDESDCAAIAAERPFVQNYCGKTNLAQLASLCAGAVYCIGNDSGPVFLAAKTAAPTVMIMGPDTDPSMSAPTGPHASYVKADNLTDLSPQQVWKSLSLGR